MACGRRRAAPAAKPVGAYLKTARAEGGAETDLSSEAGQVKVRPDNGPKVKLSLTRAGTFANDVVVGFEEVPFDWERSTGNDTNQGFPDGGKPMGSWSERGYYLCYNDASGVEHSYGIIHRYQASRTDANGLQTQIAYCLNHDLDMISGSGESTSVRKGMTQITDGPTYDNAPPYRDMCAIVWLLANGYYKEDIDGNRTDLEEFFEKLGVPQYNICADDPYCPNDDRGNWVDWFQELDAIYLTQAAIWRILDDYKREISGSGIQHIHFCNGPNAVCPDCGAGSLSSLDFNPLLHAASCCLIKKMNQALEKLVSLARNRSTCGRPAEWNDDDFPQPPEYQISEILKHYKDATMPMWYDEPRRSQIGARIGSQSQQMGSSCTFSYADFVTCGQDSPGMQWALAPTSSRMICGKNVVGPIQMDHTAGSEPDMVVESCCACADGFGYSFVDVCGNPLISPGAGDQVFLSMRVTGRFMCYRVCGSQHIDVELKEKRVYLLETGTHSGIPPQPPIVKNQGLGTSFRDKHEAENADDETCMMICTKIAVEVAAEQALPLPTPMPLFYQQLRLPPPPPCPPEIYVGKPIISEPPLPPKATLPTPAQSILIAPPPLPPPPMVFTPPPVVAQRPPMPMPPPPYVAQRPILQSPVQPPAPPRPVPQLPAPQFLFPPPLPPQAAPQPSPVPAILQGRPPEPQLPTFDLTMPITNDGCPVPYSELQTNLINRLNEFIPRRPEPAGMPSMPPPAPPPHPVQLEVPHYSELQNDLLQGLEMPVIPRRMEYPFANGLSCQPPGYAARTQPPTPFGGA